MDATLTGKQVYASLVQCQWRCSVFASQMSFGQPSRYTCIRMRDDPHHDQTGIVNLSAYQTVSMAAATPSGWQEGL